jgi:branched-chain amino acid transport system substrate-binding protein
MRARGWKHFATLNTTDGSGQIADRDIGNLLKTPEFADMQLVTAEHFNPTDTSVTAQVSKIKALAPQAVIVWSPGTPFGTALHGIQDVGLDVPVVTTSANMIVTQLKQYANVIPKSGIYFQSVAYVAGVSGRKESPAMTTFVTAIKSAGLAQDFQSGVAWDPAMIVIDGLRKLGPNATGSQLQSYLAGLHDYVGITGTYDFREAPQRGLTVDDALIERWDPDKLDFVQVSKFGGAPL